MDVISVALTSIFRFVCRAVILLVPTSICKNIVTKILAKCGITLNGSNPWDMVVKNPRTYKRLTSDGSLGMGECYVEGWWECQDLEEFWYRYYRAGPIVPINERILYKLGFCVTNQQTKSKSSEVAESHYDYKDELFKNFLDAGLNYSCGYWKNAATLEEAQLHKMDLIGRKLKLKPGMTVADLGCGYGTLAKFLAEKYGVKVVGCTNSKEQVAYGKKLCQDLPVDIRLLDYRDLNEKFDRIVTVGLMEHVGHKNYRNLFEVTHKCLKDDGIFLLHTIGISHKDMLPTSAWLAAYAYQGGMVPYDDAILGNIKGLFIPEDWHNFGNDYYKTFMSWHKNFTTNLDKLREHYDEKFLRIWNYYLLSTAASFRARRTHLWQIVMSKDGLVGGYQSER